MPKKAIPSSKAEAQKRGRSFRVPLQNADWSTTARVSIDDAGRLLIPSKVRKLLGFEPGSELSLIVDEDSIRIVDVDYAIDSLQRFAKAKHRKKKSIASTFIQERELL